MKRGFRIAGVLVAALLVVVLAGLWLLRFRVAGTAIDKRLAQAGVPASYRLTRMGPFHQRIEDLRLGPPGAPDLVARRVDVRMRYGLAGPEVREVAVDGVALRATLDGRGLRLGALDRLLPKTGSGGVTLPNLAVRLHDARIALATPNGALAIVVEGAGNPQRSFVGRAQMAAPEVRVASCVIRSVDADLHLLTRQGLPRVAGPVTIGSAGCANVALARGVVTLDGSADARFRELALGATLAGFGGHAGPVRFGAMAGPMRAAGRFGSLDLTARLAIAHASLPGVARQAGSARDVLSGTPFGPTLARASDAAVRLFGQADASLDLAAAVRGSQVRAMLRRAIVSGRDGASVRVTDRGGTGWTADGWRTDVDLATAGGGLPSLSFALRQERPGAPWHGQGHLARYATGTASLAFQNIRVTNDPAGTTVSAAMLADGPVAGGFVGGLAMPIHGRIDPTGTFTINAGCLPLAIGSLRLSAFRFGPARTTLCGRPLVTNHGGAVALRAMTGPLILRGHTGAATPVSIVADQLEGTRSQLSASNIRATIGDSAAPTRLAASHFVARFSGPLGGDFTDGSATIGAVPIGIDRMAGGWTLDATGALRLAGNLRARDLAEAPRFLPLAAEDAKLALAANVITARATMRPPGRPDTVLTIDLVHNLATEAGHTRLDVPGIVFAPKALQPEMLTPLTLGVVANVAGTIAGEGRIDWTDAGVTSTGTFGTDRLDLAAAFGPVTGIKGQLRFTDLLGLVSAPNQTAAIAAINPGVEIADGQLHYSLPGDNKVRVESATWPFAGGTLRLDATTLDLAADAERRMTFRIIGLDAAAFVQQLDLPNISATGTFDGELPMVFGRAGGRVADGRIAAREPGGTLAYVGELSRARLGRMGELAFDALKAIRYSSLDIQIGGPLDGEMVSRVRFTGVRQATPERGLAARLIRNLPFRFNIGIRAPFRGLVGSARSYLDPRLLLQQPPLNTASPPDVQPPASETLR